MIQEIAAQVRELERRMNSPTYGPAVEDPED
jgi:hypothetical protein